MRHLSICLLPFVLGACAPEAAPGADAGDSGAAGSSGPEPAPLATPSGGCPDLSTGGSLTIESSGQERDFTLVLPDPMPDELPLVFFFHGITNEGPDPAAQTVSGLRLQDVADEHGVAVVVPVAPVQSILGFSFHLWDIAMETGDDVVLYDDLRACMAEQHPVDLHRVVAAGFSGGSLFTTVIAAQRGDTLAAVVEGSGGADIEIPIYDDLASKWTASPEVPFPTLLVTGGESDEWPGGGIVIVNFLEATDTFQDHLVAGGHDVVRCDHGMGHTVTNESWSLMVDWAVSHRFNEPSPWATGDRSLPGICDWASGR